MLGWLDGIQPAQDARLRSRPHGRVSSAGSWADEAGRQSWESRHFCHFVGNDAMGSVVEGGEVMEVVISVIFGNMKPWERWTKVGMSSCSVIFAKIKLSLAWRKVRKSSSAGWAGWAGLGWAGLAGWAGYEYMILYCLNNDV